MSRSVRETGLSAAIYYVAHHILVQTALFLAVGLIERVAGTTVLARLGGLAAAAPILAILFFIPAMNLAGVPPLSGFLGKVGLFEAGIEDGRVLALILVIGGALTSLLTLYAIIRVWGRAFWRPMPEISALDGECRCTADRIRPIAGRPAAGAARQPTAPGHPEKAAHLPIGMVGATTAVVAVGLLLTVAAGPIYALADEAAASLSDRSVYVDAVLGSGVPAPPGSAPTESGDDSGGTTDGSSRRHSTGAGG